MEITAGISAALSNALRIEEIHARHIQELRRLQTIAIPAPARPDAVDVADLKLRSENMSLHDRVTAQESSIAKLHHQARALTKCASRALELLIRSRGSAASSDPEILQLRKCLRKSGVLDPADGNRREEKRSVCVETASKKAEGSVTAQTDNRHTDGGRLPLSQVPANHAKRQKSEKPLQISEFSCYTGVAAFNSKSEVLNSPQELIDSNNCAPVTEDDAQVTSLPIPVDCSHTDENIDELFNDPHVHTYSLAARADAPSEPLVTAPLNQPPSIAQSLQEPAPQLAASDWMSAKPGNLRMNFAAAVTTTAAPSVGARVAWDAPRASDDFAVNAHPGHAAAALVKPALVAYRQITEQLPPTIEKPQNFIQVVRGGARDKLPGHGCKQCDEFYAVLESVLPQGQMPANLCNGSHHAADARISVANIRENASRHRAVYRKQDSPEDYWTTKFKE